MNDIEILRIISKYNPWWTGNKIPKAKTLDYRRRFFYTLMHEIDTNKIVAVLGPRRVGKTVLIYQVIEQLLRDKVSPENIIYVSLDDTELKRESIKINNILETYYRLILKKPFDESKETVYVFLDEIQGVEDWHKTLKNVWDLKYNIKFFVSGSSSMALSKGAMESLLGRINLYVILPFKFTEILEYKKILELKRTEFIALRKAFVNSLVKSEPKSLFNEFSNILGRVVPIKDKIVLALNNYFVIGGYPEFLESDNDYLAINQNIQEKIRFTFYQDIIKFYKLRNALVLDELFSMIASSSGSKTSINKTAQDLDIQRPTLKNYLQHLKDIFLISDTEFYSKSRRTRAHKNRKFYVIDTGIRNSSVGMLDDSILNDQKEIGSIVECFAFDCLMRLKFNLEPSPSPKLFHWNNRKEVDFVFELKKHIVPIEVKYSNSISKDDIAPIEEFMKEFKTNFGIILSKDVFELRGNILILPIWLFALMV